MRPGLGLEENVGIKLRWNAVEPGIALQMRPGAADLQRDIAVAQIAVEHDLADRGAGYRRFGAVIDRVELQVRKQRQLEMQLGLGASADLRRLDAHRMNVMERFAVDDLERVLQRSGKRQVDRQPFERP